MALNKTSFEGDMTFLILYFILSPFSFDFFNTEDTHGEGMVIFFGILLFAAVTLFCSAIIVYYLRKNMDSKWMELYVALITFIVALLISLTYLEPNATSTSKAIFVSFVKGNSVALTVLYIARKLFSM
jgi:apolipoprotein N-acyltransferase